MYVSLDKKYLEKTKDEASKRCAAEFGEDEGKDGLLYEDLDVRSVELEFDNGRLLWSGETDLGFFSIEIDLDDDIAFEIIEYMKEKGEKLKRLINLSG